MPSPKCPVTLGLEADTASAHDLRAHVWGQSRLCGLFLCPRDVVLQAGSLMLLRLGLAGPSLLSAPEAGNCWDREGPEF